MALLETSVEANHIITIRTVQGFEIVGKFVSESAAGIKVNKPLLVAGITSGAESGVTKALWGKLGDTFATLGNVEINSVNILMAGATHSSIASQYTTAVS
tara:strand:- start:299 stop:598 length:300 start_codon:yes stop_codon:yes gene_type:complete